MYTIIEGIIIIIAVGGAVFFIVRKFIKTLRGKRPPDCCSGAGVKKSGRDISEKSKS
jgi:hypothetical protein